MILTLMILVAHGVARGARAVRWIGVWLLVLGSMYLASMMLRLALGLTLLAHVAWFAKPLPALFHVVLASYLLALSHYHLRGARSGPRNGLFVS